MKDHEQILNGLLQSWNLLKKHFYSTKHNCRLGSQWLTAKSLRWMDILRVICIKIKRIFTPPYTGQDIFTKWWIYVNKLCSIKLIIVGPGENVKHIHGLHCHWCCPWWNKENSWLYPEAFLDWLIWLERADTQGRVLPHHRLAACTSIMGYNCWKEIQNDE